MKTRRHLTLAAAEMAALGVRARPVWVLREPFPGTTCMCLGVEIGGGTYTTEEAGLCSVESARDWATIVATLERGVVA